MPRAAFSIRRRFPSAVAFQLQSGNRLLRKPDVSARVEELKTAASERQVEKIAVDRAWVVAQLIENVKRAMQVEPVRDREGNATGQYTYQGSVANKALELLGKELGMFQQKDDETDLTSDEIIQRLHAGRERVAMMPRMDADASDPTNPISKESEHSRIVNADVVAHGVVLWPAAYR